MCVMSSEMKKRRRAKKEKRREIRDHPYKRTLPIAETRTASNQNPGSDPLGTKPVKDRNFHFGHIGHLLEESTNDGHVIQSVHHFYVGIEQDFIDSNSAFL